MWSRIPHPNFVILKLFGLIRIKEAVCVCCGFFGQIFHHFPYWANPAGGLERGKNLSKGNHSWCSSCSWLACFFCRSLAVGSKSGYKFFSLSSVDKLEQIYECSEYLFFPSFFNPLSWLNVGRIRNISFFHRLFEIGVKGILSVNITQIQNSDWGQGTIINQFCI